jgi:hypothetical protein
MALGLRSVLKSNFFFEDRVEDPIASKYRQSVSRSVLSNH